MSKKVLIGIAVAIISVVVAFAIFLAMRTFSSTGKQIGSVNTTFRFTGSDKVVVEVIKDMKVVRMLDKENQVLVYLIYSTKLINGSPFNSILSVPLMPWNGELAKIK